MIEPILTWNVCSKIVLGWAKLFSKYFWRVWVLDQTLWTSSIRIKIKNKNIIIIYVSGIQICLMRSSCGPDISFETLKSKFDCLKTIFFFFKFLWFLVILGQNQEKILIFIQSTEINRKLQYTVVISYYSEDF